MLDTSKFDWGILDNNWGKECVVTEIFEDNIYERFFQVEKDDIVVDIGASIGPFTYSILHKNPKHVYCIEPSEAEFPTLVKNTIGYPVTHILKGIGDSNSSYVEQDNIYGFSHMESITFNKFKELYNIDKIDFLKIDCEGGEYNMFNNDNLDWIKHNIKKISGEWHLSGGLNSKFRYFRDNYLSYFNNYEIYSVDGVNIKWDLWNEHFLEYYTEVIIYIDNR
jgi:FkbM family methyltransferase